MRLAVDDLFRAFWSERVQDEWTQAIFRDRPNLPRAQIERTRRLMDDAIDDAVVVGYEPLIETLTLPDADDRHVLAAAIYCRASVIVTANLRDFPREVISLHGIEAQHPDRFILDLFGMSPTKWSPRCIGSVARSRTAADARPASRGDVARRVDRERRRARRIHRRAVESDAARRQGAGGVDRMSARWSPTARSR